MAVEKGQDVGTGALQMNAVIDVLAEHGCRNRRVTLYVCRESISNELLQHLLIDRHDFDSLKRFVALLIRSGGPRCVESIEVLARLPCG